MLALFGPRSGRFPRHHRPVPSNVEVAAQARALHNPTGVRVV